jgi:hypothetical protein
VCEDDGPTPILKMSNTLMAKAFLPSFPGFPDGQ